VDPGAADRGLNRFAASMVNDFLIVNRVRIDYGYISIS
jgi:hypothetical protein